MTYYHVRLYTTQNPQSWEWVPDLSHGQLERRVLALYRAGKPITLKGKSTSTDDLERITIDATDGSWETAHRTRRDVTDEFITGPPRTQELGILRKFSDIDGLHLLRMDNTAQRRNQLARRLQSAG